MKMWKADKLKRWNSEKRKKWSTKMWSSGKRKENGVIPININKMISNPIKNKCKN